MAVRASAFLGPGQRYVTFEAIGQSSGKRAGTVIQGLNAAPPVPGLAIAPHAINQTTGTATFDVFGTRFRPNTTVSLYRNGVFIGSATTDPTRGVFGTTITPANGPDTSAIYTAVTTTVGSMAGTASRSAPMPARHPKAI